MHTGANVGVGSWIRRRAALAPHDVALVHGDVRRTYAELANRIDCAAAAIRAQGVRPGDRVAYQGRDEPIALESFFATGMLGAVWVPILPGRSPDDVQHIVDDAEVRLLVRGALDDDLPQAPVMTAADLEHAMVSRPAEVPPPVAVSFDDLAILGYTSGTTGRPKGTMLTHGNLTANVLNMLSACAMSRTDSTVALAPLTRLGGLGVVVLELFFVGGRVILPVDTRPARLLETLARERVSVLFANPVGLEGLARDPAWQTTDLSSIRTGIVGGDIVPEPLLRTYLDRGVPLCHGYGLTEAAPVVTLLDERDAQSKFGSVGRPIGLVEVAIEGQDRQAPPAGETGEILVRGPNVTSGYWRCADSTAAASAGYGWWRTGDAGWLDGDGCLYVVGRTREAFDIDGERFFPGEIERVLHGHPLVADAAAVRGPAGIVLFVVSAGGSGSEDLSATLERVIPRRKASIAIRPIDRIPRNAAGKIRRAELGALLG
ncbi:MAG: AMP-binding protein [Gemmatimonadota bacterium]